MKKILKNSALVLSIASLSVSTAFALTPEPISTAINQAEDEIAHPFYMSFTGTVKEINENLVSLESKDGAPANFYLSDNTYYVDNAKVEVGVEITGFYESGRPMIMIYPPQYSVDIVAPVKEDSFIKADEFDENLISADKMLKLNLSEDTEIVWENDTAINWLVAPSISDLEVALSNRKLVVIYDITTKSIPAQTTPKKIIVLSGQSENNIINVSGHEFLINGDIIEAPSAYNDDSGIVMVPLRAVSEALGFEVLWNEENQSISIGKNITLSIGEEIYRIDNVAEALTLAPLLKDSTTYVPLDFFDNIASKPYISGEQIIINSLS